MLGIGSQLKWFEGKIMYPSYQWRSPSKRRVPRLLIENRALEVGILIYVEEPWVVFEETDIKVDQIEMNKTEPLKLYQYKFQLLPAKFKRQNTYQWMSRPSNALLLFGKDLKYYIKAFKRSSP
ncbi:hypothetical protein A3F00_04900 [Candidatus Daviesbacteria bacterium RIFCSPHIGHO2_12_FULL_37_11]|uniref:Uncharacterized protein n=1 Tax=Candidatus Daviesbacteria bacterium RIFCSPHIGHO2_12_FULL_37_11 TaxID=1797777 RepID=A0A1F5K9T6_9BACT|nr:MAG: hypothetical protein A2769_04645 [Candidatus Daviesbacteria bacterium RIFCSPHIGHO2_01_FULL_37_27]OGE37575.1 MAG: hypothetical protein A3F00_04900 [Candidatus Daviesbacteria bacterium RIFCSPHIGHO2_12_FULL_37_11]OGE46013.1 MAG: hypothetical protein A3B39_03310 [Candidatus Daviesbacteria bacterium RIFCSPLOWO2_01_FULL_37_10]